jgi:hypothetical protein
MAGLRPHLEHGPETHLASVNIVGGTFVEPDGATGKVKPVTAANSPTVLGLAIGDAAATAGAVAPVADAWGRYTSGQLTPPNEVAVAYRGSWWIRNTTGGALLYGTRVYAGVGGVLAGSGTGPVVGIVIEPGGIANAAEGRVRLTLS